MDDEKQFVKFLSKRLALRGKDADYAFTGEDAVKKVEATRYDVAILDVKMPGIGGIELKRKLSGLAPDMKIINAIMNTIAAIPHINPPNLTSLPVIDYRITYLLL